jgi:DNA polymerase-3 subunit delta
MTALKRGDFDRALGSPDPSIRLWLLAGPDESASADAARRLLAALSDAADPMAVTDLSPGELASDPGRLADEAASVSMFGGRRAIRVAGVGENVAEAARLLLAAAAAGNPVVMTAGDLGRTSGLRRLAETSGEARILLSYPLDAREAMRWLAQEARRRGMEMGEGVAERLLAATGGDLGVLASELEKFSLFLGAEPGVPRRLESEHLLLLGADSAEEDMFALVAALTADDARAAEVQFRLLSGTSPIPALRAMARRLLQLAEARSAMRTGLSAEAAAKALRPPVFWKEQAAFVAALGRWSPRRIADGLEAMLAAERAIKAPGSAGDSLGWAALLALMPGR